MKIKLAGITLVLLTTLVNTTPLAQTATSGATTGTTTPTPATATNPTDKLTSQFSQWAGSPENANALVTGLRSGKPITLTSPTNTSSGNTAGTAPSASASTTFTPATEPMGYGNIKIALSLAKTQLAQQGITQPTPEQLQTALNGGQLVTAGGTGTQMTTMQGVLQMRADGMGWGQIANSMGIKLGTVMSGKANVAPATSRSGITTASGNTITASKAHGKGITTGSGSTNPSAKAQGKGITTASGSASTAGKGQGKSGIVTASGSAGGSSITTGAGQAGRHGAIASASGNVGRGNAGGNQGKSGK